MARVLILMAAALLFLSAAATIRVVYTIQPSYALMIAALVVGAPWIWRGWGGAHPAVRLSALALVIAYGLALSFSQAAVLPGREQASGHRGLVYMADLLVGLGIVGLIAGLWARRRVEPLLLAFASGAAAAALYGDYQWFAQRFGWPFAHINNTLDTNGITHGADLGPGVFGWERIRGTFVEPILLAGYLAALLPLWVALIVATRGWVRRVSLVASAVILAALVLTSSPPAWALLTLGAIGGAAVWGVARGWPIVAGAAGAALACAVVMGGILFFVAPDALSGVTGRSLYSNTIEFRRDAWEQSIDTWSNRPLTGYGPGQSAVRLATAPGSSQASPGPPQLKSAQGIWAASLIDGGVVALWAWALFLTAMIWLAATTLTRRPSPLTAALLACVVVVAGGSQVVGDRLFPTAWFIFGFVLAVAGRHPGESDPNECYGSSES